MYKKIRINEKIAAILAVPENIQGKIPLVLFFHGFGSHKDEVGNTFAIAAEKLMANQIASIRVDFCGFGESDGKTEETTVDSLLQDAYSCITYISSLDFVDKDKIGICGFSLGAGIAILCQNSQNTAIKSIALLSPAGNLPKDFQSYLGQDNYQRLSAANNAIILNLGWREISLTKKFTDSLECHSPFKSATSYYGAFFVIAGKNDFSYENANTYNETIPSNNKKIKIISNCDHIFNAFNENGSFVDEVTEDVSHWFKNSL